MLAVLRLLKTLLAIMCESLFHIIGTKRGLGTAFILHKVRVCVPTVYYYVTATKTKLQKSSCESCCKPTLTAFPRMNFFIVENRPVSFFCILPRPLTGDGSTSQCFRLAWDGWVRRPKFGCWGALRTLSLIMLQRHIEHLTRGEKEVFTEQKGPTVVKAEVGNFCKNVF